MGRRMRQVERAQLIDGKWTLWLACGHIRIKQPRCDWFTGDMHPAPKRCVCTECDDLEHKKRMEALKESIRSGGHTAAVPLSDPDPETYQIPLFPLPRPKGYRKHE